MAAARKVVELPIGETELAELRSIARSRTEPASHVARARMLLHYRDNPSCHAVGRAVGVTHQTVQRCLARAIRFGVMAALDDSPRPGKEPEITVPARAWLVSLACRKAKDMGYPHELWTTRLLARHSREHGPAARHASLARIAQGTVCKLLAEQEVKPHKVRYYLERRDPEFEAKMAEVLTSTLSKNRAVSRPPLDVEDRFIPKDFMCPIGREPEPADVSEGTPAFPDKRPVEQFEAVGLRDRLQAGERRIGRRVNQRVAAARFCHMQVWERGGDAGEDRIGFGHGRQCARCRGVARVGARYVAA